MHPGHGAFQAFDSLAEGVIAGASLQLERRLVRCWPSDRGHVPSRSSRLHGCYPLPWIAQDPPSPVTGVSATLPTMPTLARLSVTPVKGTSIAHPENAQLTEAGIPGDRLFYFVDERGAPYSGSTFGPLVRIDADHDPRTERLRLRFPDGTEVDAPAGDLGAPETTDMYGRDVAAHVVEGPFAQAVSAFCSKQVRLLRCDRDGDGSDVEPLTLVSSSSVRDLAERGRYEGELDARRFRMNLEIDGSEPYEEDSWVGHTVRVGDATIEVGAQVPRCVFTTKSPDSGEKDWDTLTQIAKYRPRIGGRGGLPFGVYARIVQPGLVQVGDDVTPLEP